jgi:hypothetical protein
MWGAFRYLFLLKIPRLGALTICLILVGVGCTSAVQKNKLQIETNLETLPDQTLAEIFSTTTHSLRFQVRKKNRPSAELVVTATTSNPVLVSDPTVTLEDVAEGTYRLDFSQAAAQVGVAEITVSIFESSNLIKEKKFLVTVTTSNKPPEIATVANQTLDQGSTLSGLNLTISDRETSAASLTVAAVSQNQTLLPNSRITLGGSGASRTLSLNPIPVQNGSTVITVTVTDGDGASTSINFSLSVTPAGGGGGGAPPTISGISDQTIDEDTSTTALSFTVGDANQPANTVSVAVASSNTTVIPVSGIAIAGEGATRTVTITPALNQNGGPVTITLTASDGTLTTPTTFNVTVTPVNDAPTISNIIDQTIVGNTSTGTLLFTIGDIETAAGSLVVTGTSSNTTLVPNVNIALAGTTASRTVNITPVANLWGTTTITLQVSDGNLTIQDTFLLTVLEPKHQALSWTYPPKDGFKIGESDDQSYEV